MTFWRAFSPPPATPPSSPSSKATTAWLAERRIREAPERALLNVHASPCLCGLGPLHFAPMPSLWTPDSPLAAAPWPLHSRWRDDSGRRDWLARLAGATDWLNWKLTRLSPRQFRRNALPPRRPRAGPATRQMPAPAYQAERTQQRAHAYAPPHAPHFPAAASRFDVEGGGCRERGGRGGRPRGWPVAGVGQGCIRSGARHA